MTRILKFQTAKKSGWRIKPAEIAAVGLALIDGLGFGAYSLLPAGASGTSISVHFSLCSGPVRVTCVVDGDTFWLDGTKIRVADIDACVPACKNWMPIRGELWTPIDTSGPDLHVLRAKRLEPVHQTHGWREGLSLF